MTMLIHPCTQEYEAIYRASIAVAQHPHMGDRQARRKRADDESDDENDRCVVVLVC